MLPNLQVLGGFDDYVEKNFCQDPGRGGKFDTELQCVWWTEAHINEVQQTFEHTVSSWFSRVSLLWCEHLSASFWTDLPPAVLCALCPYWPTYQNFWLPPNNKRHPYCTEIIGLLWKTIIVKVWLKSFVKFAPICET